MYSFNKTNKDSSQTHWKEHSNSKTVSTHQMAVKNTTTPAGKHACLCMLFKQDNFSPLVVYQNFIHSSSWLKWPLGHPSLAKPCPAKRVQLWQWRWQKQRLPGKKVSTTTTVNKKHQESTNSRLRRPSNTTTSYNERAADCGYNGCHCPRCKKWHMLLVARRGGHDKTQAILWLEYQAEVRNKQTLRALAGDSEYDNESDEDNEDQGAL